MKSVEAPKEQWALDRLMRGTVLVLVGLLILVCLGWARWIWTHPSECQCSESQGSSKMR
jgi:hypothetical protein